jgi:hypothetical protein
LTKIERARLLMMLVCGIFLGIALASVVITPSGSFAASGNADNMSSYIDGSHDCWKWVHYPHGFGEWQQFKTSSPCEGHECHMPRYELREVCHNVLGKKGK